MVAERAVRDFVGFWEAGSGEVEERRRVRRVISPPVSFFGY